MGVDLHSGADLLLVATQVDSSPSPSIHQLVIVSSVRKTSVNTEPFIRFISSWGVETKYSVPGANRFAAY